MTPERPRILCVDDEPMVLEGLSLHLPRTYEVVTAGSGREGLALLEQGRPFAVVLSDMRMPGMDGAAFLGQVRVRSPDTVRMLLTGHAEIEDASAAINEGQIFRFLIKPCPPDHLKLAFSAALEQHRLITSERELLEQTLRGAVRALIEVLSLASPLAFGRGARIQGLVRQLAQRLHPSERWVVEVAAMLSQLGCIALPDDTLARLDAGEELDASDRAALGRIPEVAEGLLANIPRLEPVREVLARFWGVAGKGAAPGAGAMVGNAVAILRIASDYDQLESRGYPPQLALDTLRGRGGHPPRLLEDFAAIRDATGREAVVKEVPLAALRVGMVVIEDLRTSGGLLLVGRGLGVTVGLLQRLGNFKGAVREPIRVVIGGPVGA